MCLFPFRETFSMSMQFLGRLRQPLLFHEPTVFRCDQAVQRSSTRSGLYLLFFSSQHRHGDHSLCGLSTVHWAPQYMSFLQPGGFKVKCLCTKSGHQKPACLSKVNRLIPSPVTFPHVMLFK